LDNAVFDALSYSWGMSSNGDDRPNLEIFPNGYSKAITRNLHEASLRLRHACESKRMWIDAVCINQNDQREESTQFIRMRDIHATARQVFIWLGEGEIEELEEAAYTILACLGEKEDHV
jgi:hypothetical protein